jgi:DNA-binding IclR family transcriptional regulator
MAANKTVIKTLRILELISKSPEGITLAEIYRELNLPKASVYDILQSLYNEDAVYYKNETTKTYVIGSKLFSIGQAYTKNSNFIAFASPMLKDFANEFGVTTFCCKRLGTKVTYVYKYESNKARLTTDDIGTQLPLHKSVSGLALLAFMSKEKQAEILEEILQKEFGNLRSEAYQKMVAELDKYKSDGHVFKNGTMDPFTCELAIPVYNFENKAVGAIASTRLVFQKGSDAEIREYIEKFKQIAENISFKQGHRS